MKVGIVGGTGFEQLGRLFESWREESLNLNSGHACTIVHAKLRHLSADVLFLRRHGREHEVAPHQVRYNDHAQVFRELGVKAVVGTAICGSLKAELPPGSVVIPDQVVDLTRTPNSSSAAGNWLHLPFGEPYCPRLRKVLATSRAVSEANISATTGCVATIEGPRFATRAEAQWMARQGWDLVNMTQSREAQAFREAGLCYATLAFVTDFAYGLGLAQEHEIAGSMAGALRVFQKIVQRAPMLLGQVVEAVLANATGDCSCREPMPREYYREPPR